MRSFKVPRWQWLFARIYLGIRRPKRSIGMELAGEVESVVKMLKGLKKAIRFLYQLSGWILALC